ncbi:MAG: acetyl-CoA carboxylase biotin carboxyl carrier protein subunit [Myxococcales bacterium]|nr:acetyl-CoA carboxylase biotin carboxyl carrier protein subunit [Myxococcales bacterium]
MLIDGQSWEAGASPREGGWLIDVLGLSTEVDVVDPRRAVVARAAARGGKVICAQMPGRVVRVLVTVGDVVRRGQPLLVLEAMKMENELKAAGDGSVAELYVNEGQAVELGARLVRLE